MGGSLIVISNWTHCMVGSSFQRCLVFFLCVCVFILS